VADCHVDLDRSLRFLGDEVLAYPVPLSGVGAKLGEFGMILEYESSLQVDGFQRIEESGKAGKTRANPL